MAPLQRGFALVVTLSLMILLTVVAVGLLTLSSISLRSSSQGEAAASARANARLALIMAIGELQLEMGPDSRISAPHDAGTAATGGQPHWTAVYDAWKSAPDGTPETPQSRSPEFRGWLASGANQASGGPAGTAEKALLLGPNSLGGSGNAADEIRVPMHAVNTGGKAGRIAWWTADESAKAKVTAGPDALAASSFGISDSLFGAQSPPNIGHRAFPKLAQFDWKDGKRAITVSTNQINLAAGLGPGGLGNSIHDLTVHSAGVLADVRAGRLRRDLSNLLARPAQQLQDMPLYLANGRMNRFVITENGGVSNAPGLVKPWTQASNTADEWGINLEELHLFHNLHRELSWSGGSPRLLVKNTREQVVRDRYYLYKRPVVEAVQFILSLKAVQAGGVGNYKMEMMLDGVVALSNPNDVPIVWPAGLILPLQLQNIPYRLNWNIQKANGTFDKRSSASPNFGLFVGRIGGGVGSSSTGFTLQPGEAATFGSTSASGANLNLLPGFVPGGGVRMTQWNLNADQLKPEDQIDFNFVKNSDPGFQGTHSYYNIWIGDRKGGASPKGWQIDATVLGSGGDLNSTLMNQLMISPIRPPQVLTVRDFLNDPKPKPIMMFSFLRNVEQASGAVPMDAFASRPFQLSEPAAAGRNLTPSSTATARHFNQMLITAEPMNYQFRTLAAGDGGRNVYHGGGRQPGLGGNFSVIKRRIPIAPPLSMGAFENAIASGFAGRFSSAPAIAGDPYPADAVALSGHRSAWPITTKAIGNSFSSPFVDVGRVYRGGSGAQPATKTAADHSWMANTALWDSWFLSGIVDGTGAGSSAWLKDSRSPRAQFNDLVKSSGLLRNKRYLFHPHKTPDEALKELFTGENFKPSALNQLSKYLLVDGAFNVNSTSVRAWAAFLSSVRDQTLLSSGGASKKFEHPFGTLGYAANTATSGTEGDWAGLRALTSGEIDQLATEIVTQVRERGPFLSLADFVNRRPSSGNPSHQVLGALQAAIDEAGLNKRYAENGREVTPADFQTLPGSEGLTQESAPARAVGSAGHLSQGALLTAIGSQITVRSDTFTIRAYGDYRDASGKIQAKAWCEAVVQRVPEYIDPADSPEAQEGWPQAGKALAFANSRFGRRMRIQSFRWLSSNEI